MCQPNEIIFPLDGFCNLRRRRKKLTSFTHSIKSEAFRAIRARKAHTPIAQRTKAAFPMQICHLTWETITQRPLMMDGKKAVPAIMLEEMKL